MSRPPKEGDHGEMAFCLIAWGGGALVVMLLHWALLGPVIPLIPAMGPHPPPDELQIIPRVLVALGMVVLFGLIAYGRAEIELRGEPLSECYEKQVIGITLIVYPLLFLVDLITLIVVTIQHFIGT